MSDCTVWDKNSKKYDYDLVAGKLHFHVKSHSVEQARLFDNSWVFEKTDYHIFKRYDDLDYVVFTTVNYDAKEVCINGKKENWKKTNEIIVTNFNI